MLSLSSDVEKKLLCSWCIQWFSPSHQNAKSDPQSDQDDVRWLGKIHAQEDVTFYFISSLTDVVLLFITDRREHDIAVTAMREFDECFIDFWNMISGSACVAILCRTSISNRLPSIAIVDVDAGHFRKSLISPKQPEYSKKKKRFFQNSIIFLMSVFFWPADFIIIYASLQGIMGDWGVRVVYGYSAKSNV